MKMVKWFPKVWFTLSMLAVGIVLAMGASPRALDAAECGGPGETLCKETEHCVRILFYRACTTNYDYWSTDDREIVEK